MRGDGEHEVVVALVHQLDPGAHALPERGQALDGWLIPRVGRGLGRQDGPTVVEQLGEARIGTGELGPGDGVARHHVDARRGGGGHRLAHRAFDRADVRQRGAGLEPLGAGGRHSADGARRGGEQHEVGAPGGVGGIGENLVGDAQLGHPLAHGRAGVGDGDAVGDAVRAGGPHHGRSNQAAADHRYLVVDHIGHGGFQRFMNSDRMSTTARLCSSRPMVIRRWSGSP